MSKPRYGWWPYIKNVIYSYPALRSLHQQSLAQQITPAYSGQSGGSSGNGRKTEQTVVRASTRTAAREYEAVHLAIQQTRQLDGGAERLRLIRLVYWARSHTLTGAAQEVHVSFATAKRWHGEFVRLVAKNFGLLD